MIPRRRRSPPRSPRTPCRAAGSDPLAEIKGGERLKRRLAEIAVGLSKAATLKVGFLSGATYPDGTPVAEVAAYNDFGTRRSPARPFFRNMVAEKQGGWPSAIALNLKAVDYDAAAALDRVGEGVAGQLRQSIIDTNSPPLAASTIARKGFDKPLIDTSHMINSVDHEVE